MNNYLFVGFAVLVLSLTIGQSFQIRGLAVGTAGTVTGALTAGGQLDTTGWTADEIMNYEHHGIIPARVQQTAVAVAPQMVGGC